MIALALCYLRFALFIPVSTADKIIKHQEKVLSIAKMKRKGKKQGKNVICVLVTCFICLYARKLGTIPDLQVGFLTWDTHTGFSMLLCFLPYCHLFESVCV